MYNCIDNNNNTICVYLSILAVCRSYKNPFYIAKYCFESRTCISEMQNREKEWSRIVEILIRLLPIYFHSFFVSFSERKKLLSSICIVMQIYIFCFYLFWLNDRQNAKRKLHCLQHFAARNFSLFLSFDFIYIFISKFCWDVAMVSKEKISVSYAKIFLVWIQMAVATSEPSDWTAWFIVKEWREEGMEGTKSTRTWNREKTKS